MNQTIFWEILRIYRHYWNKSRPRFCWWKIAKTNEAHKNTRFDQRFLSSYKNAFKIAAHKAVRCQPFQNYYENLLEPKFLEPEK